MIHGSHISGFGAGSQLIYGTNYTRRDERVSHSGRWHLQFPPGFVAGWDEQYLSPVSAPWNPSQKAIRAVIHVGDDWNGTGYPRSELSLDTSIDLVAGNRYFISFGFWWPASAAGYLNSPTSRMVVLFQFHHRDNIGSPPVAFVAINGGLEIQMSVGWLRYPVYSAGEIPIERLVAVDIEFIPSSGRDGLFRLWLDGSLVVDHSGPCATVSEGVAGYLKQGLYDFASTVPDYLTVYLDDLLIQKQ